MQEVEQNEDGVSSEIEGKGKLPEYLIEHPKDPATGMYNVSERQFLIDVYIYKIQCIPA